MELIKFLLGLIPDMPLLKPAIALSIAITAMWYIAAKAAHKRDNNKVTANNLLTTQVMLKTAPLAVVTGFMIHYFFFVV